MTTFFVCSPPNGAVSRTEDAAAAAGGCPQSVESAVLRTFEDAFGTPEGRFRYRISLPYRRSLFFTPNASDDASRTPGSLFEHRMRIPYRRSLFLVRCASENASHLVVRSTGKRVAVASERPVQPRTGRGEWSARDKFRVSGTKEMVEGAGANKVSEVLSEASCCRCETSNFTKKEADLFSLFFCS